MPSPSSVNTKDSNVRRASGISSSSTRSSTSPSLSVFSNAKHTLIKNSSVRTIINNTTINNNDPSATSSLGLLYKSVAPNAILNAGGRADEVRCHPGTREEVIGLVKKSIAQQYTEPRMLWLSGPAGAGKSAIMQTVAEQCKKQGLPHANFFFFRADRSRNNASSFVATIMHQIIKLYPAVGPAVSSALESDPFLLQMSIQDQFDVFLREALSSLHHTSPSPPPLALLIDGLDECDSENKTEQRQLLQTLDALLAQKSLYFRVVVASRVEAQISMSFGQLCSQVNTIFLDAKYSPEKDIHRFVTAEFNKIKSTHYLASSLGPEWPSQSDVDGIVTKSSGQFIFAATVMRFIAYSPASPILSLQKVQGIIPPTKNSPFAQIDAVYAYILGQAEDLEAVKALLAIQLLDNLTKHTIQTSMKALHARFSAAVFESCLSELAPLIQVADGPVKLVFFHASFPDFLRDQTRSTMYHIDLEKFCAGAIPFWWQNKYAVLLIAVSSALKRLKRPTPQITTALMECKPTPDNYLFVKNIIPKLHRIYAPDDLQALIKIKQIWTSNDNELAGYFL